MILRRRVNPWESELTEFFPELTEFAVNSVRLSEFSSPKQYSRNV